jgi:hypothetical protein
MHAAQHLLGIKLFAVKLALPVGKKLNTSGYIVSG